MLGQVWTRASPWRADRALQRPARRSSEPGFLARKFASASRRTHTLPPGSKRWARRWRGRPLIVEAGLKIAPAIVIPQGRPPTARDAVAQIRGEKLRGQRWDGDGETSPTLWASSHETASLRAV